VRLTAVLYRVLPTAVGAAAIGCAQLVGIENTVGPGDSIAVTRLSIGSKVVQAPVDPAEISATYLVASRDPSGYDQVSAVPDPSHDRLTTQLRTPAPVELTLKGDVTPLRRLFAFPGPPLSVLDFSPNPATSAADLARFGNTLYGVREHPGRQDAPMGATFAVNLALDAAVAAGQSFQVYVVGAWLQRGFSGTEAPMVGAMQLAPPAFSFTAANSVSGRPQVDQITTDDAFLLLRYTGPILTGVAEAMPVTQSDMAGAQTTPTFLLPMASVAPGMLSPTFSATVMPGVIAERYKNVRPAVAAPPAVQITWSLVAAPGYTVASNAGPVLQSGMVAMTDTGVSVSYENPFATRGWNTIFTLATSVSRVYMAPMGPMGMPVPVTLFAGMNQFLEPPASTATPVPLDLPAGLPQVITIGSTVLATDNAFIKKQSSQFFNVSFTVDAPSSAADQGPRSYNLQLFDLVFNPMTMAVDRVLVFAAAGKDPAFAVPPELFQVGHSYTLRALSTLGGSPGTEQGELLHPQLPLAQAYLDSGTFTVMP
jgi:hypothetical protein